MARAVGAQSTAFTAVNPLNPTWTYGDLLSSISGAADGVSIRIFGTQVAAQQLSGGVVVQLHQLVVSFRRVPAG